MEQIKVYDELSVKNIFLNEHYFSTFRINSPTVQPKTIEFFELMYSSPANIKIKWDKADELNEDLHFKETYGITKYKSSFSDRIEQCIPNKSRIQEAIQPNYDLNNFIQGYKDKATTSNFYTKQTKPIQKALENIPVYTVLNGRGEIVLANSFNGTNKDEGKKLNLQESFYNFCGDFSTKSKKNYNLGLFFMDRKGAEMYLTEIAKSDISGTKTLGLSINCISLDSAYQITREYCSPNIDFRFVPKLDEVYNLLNSKEDFIFEKQQHQLRFRKRLIPFIPRLDSLGIITTPFNQFLSTNEYFKGVPIYLVQINDMPRSVFIENYFNFVGIIDTFSGKLTKFIGTFCGIGQNDIIEGSINDINKSDKVTNYLFFEKEQAVNFCKKQGRKVTRFKGSRMIGTESFVRKPKIYVFNFEDFIEEWEDIICAGHYNEIENIVQDTLNANIFKKVKTVFIPAEDSLIDVNNFCIESEGSLPAKKIKIIKQFFDVKKRTLLSFFDIISNNG